MSEALERYQESTVLGLTSLFMHDTNDRSKWR